MLHRFQPRRFATFATNTQEQGADIRSLLKTFDKIGQYSLPITYIMLRAEFSTADIELMKYLLHRNPVDGKSWLEFCCERDFSVAEMLDGFERSRRQAKTIDHRPIEAPLIPLP